MWFTLIIRNKLVISKLIAHAGFVIQSHEAKITQPLAVQGILHYHVQIPGSAVGSPLPFLAIKGEQSPDEADVFLLLRFPLEC